MRKEPEIHEQKVKPEERILTNKALAVMEEESRNNESKKNMPLENNGIDEEKEEEQEKQNNLRKEEDPLEKELKELKGDHEKQHRSKDMVQRTNGIHPPYERSVSAGGSFFQGILQEADQLLRAPEKANLSSQCQQLFGGTSYTEVFKNFAGNQRKFCLMVLSQLFPQLSEKIEANFKINLELFTSPMALLHYFDALITSGVTENVDRGVVFVLGNTRVGKSSFVNTLSNFLQNPMEEPEPVLADSDNKLLETQVLEIYDAKKFQHIKKLSVILKKDGSKTELINFEEDNTPTEESDKAAQLNIKLVDMGGHQEYYACSSLFISTSGVFLICFDSHLLEKAKEGAKEKEGVKAKDQVDDFYYGSVGTYIDLISNTTEKARLRPKIALVATKTELSSTGKDYNEILDRTKRHLSSVAKGNKVFLVNEVLKTSSAKVSREDLTDFHLRLATLCSDKELKEEYEEVRPASWQTLLTYLQEHSSLSFDEVVEKWQSMKKSEVLPNEDKLSINISQEDLELLTKFKTMLEPTLIETSMEEEPQIQHSDSTSQISESEAPCVQPTTPVVPKTPSTVGGSSVQTEEGEETMTPLDAVKEPTLSNPSDEYIVGGNLQNEFEKEVKSILFYLTEIGEILWFKQKQDLVICKPMDFIQSLRNIITHNLVKQCPGVQFIQTKTNIENKGILSLEDFRTIHTCKEFPADIMWDLITQLKLGFQLKKEDTLRNAQKEVMIIPSLISDKMRDKFVTEENDLNMCDNALCLNYHFDREEATVNIYFDLLHEVAKCFFWEDRGGDLRMTFGQKVENRRLGLVNGASGEIRWLLKDIKKAEKFDFMILEYENSEGDVPFATGKQLRIHLTPTEEVGERRRRITKDVFEIFQKLDKKFTKILPKGLEHRMQRSLSCKRCQKEGKHEFFFLNLDLKVKDNSRFCNKGHSLPGETEWMMEMSGKSKTPFRLKNLMKQDKDQLGLQPFATSQIKSDIMAGSLQAGAQIWIYHDKDTDPWNPVARWNPYSHCVVYVGEKDGVHEVVHVYKAWSAVLRFGLIKGTIKRMDIEEVIKPNQLVFLGHKIEGCQFAGNVLEKIAERAKKCTDPAKDRILFDYDHR